MKAAVRLATRVPTGGAPRRVYTPGGPLFARRPLKFHGVQYAKGDELPVAEMTKVRHHRMWTSGLADHERFGPFERKRRQKHAIAASAPATADCEPSATRLDAEEVRASPATVERIDEQPLAPDGRGQPFRPAHHKRRR